MTTEQLRGVAIERLKALLQEIHEADDDEQYKTRNDLVFRAVDYARGIGYPAGVRIDPLEPEWPVLFIELPTGQISWHVSQHVNEWDGHSTGEKYRRIAAFQTLGGKKVAVWSATPT